MMMNNDERDDLLRQIAADLQEMKGICHRHDRTLYGNGKPGLAETVPLIEQRQRECPARTGAKALRSALISAVVSAIIGAMVGAAMIQIANASPKVDIRGR